MIKKNMYKGLWIMTLIIILGMTTMIVRAEETSLLCNNPQDMRICLGVDEMVMTPPADWSYCSRYDFNSDGVINLADVSSLAQLCYEEPINETEEVIKPVKEEKTSGRSYSYKKEKDGSLTFRSVGTVIKYPDNNMIVSWERQTVGTICWEYQNKEYCGTFGDKYGYEYVNIKVMN